MIGELFIIFLLFSVFLIIISLAKNIQSLSMIGFIFIALLGLTLLFTGVSFKNGFDDIYVYGNNFTGYHWDYDYNVPNNAKLEEQAFVFHLERTVTYDSPSFQYSNLFGLLMLLAGVFGCLYSAGMGDD